MGWFNKPKAAAADEQLKRFLVVKRSNESWTSADYFDADEFRPHLPEPTTLVVQRTGQQAPAKHYGPNGWLSFHWENRRPSEVSFMRVDKRL